MADKVQNIVINYKFDTSQIEKAKQTLQQAETVSKNFSNTQQQGSKATQSAYQALIVEQKRLEDAIKSTRGTNFSSYKEFVKTLQGLSKQYSDVKIKIDFMNKSLQDQAKIQKEVATATKATAASTQNLASQFGNVFTAVKAFIAAGLVREVITTSLEMAKLSGNVEGVKRAFTRAFPDAQLLMSDLQRATHGTVTEFELMQRTLQATNLGVAVESLPVLFEFAAARAQQTGESVDYLVDSIVRGIGRKSILVLDNLGLSATRLREQFNGASLASQSVADVTRGVAEIAKVELAKMGGYAETAATKVDQLTVSWKGLGQQISELATQDGGLIDFMKQYVDSFALATEAINKNIGVEQLAAIKRREHNAEFSANLFFQTAFTKNKEDNIKVLDDEIARLTRSVGAWGALRDEMEKQNKEDLINLDIKKKAFPVKTDELIALTQDISFRRRLIDVKKEETLEDQEVLKLLLLRLAAMKEVEKVAESLGLIAAKQAEISDVSEKLNAAKSTTEINRLNNELSILNGQLADLKAFGTTKQLLQVDGKVKLVPITSGELKKYTVDLQNRFGELEVHIKAVMDVVKPDSNRIFGTADTDAMIAGIPQAQEVSIKPVFVPSDWDLIAEEFAENWQNIVGQGLSNTTSLIDASLQAEADSYDQRLNEARAYYDNQLTLAGDNEKAKDRIRLKAAQTEKKLRREAFEADKRAKKSSAIINGAAGIINAFATLPYPAAVVAALLIAAETATQVAVISKENPRFAKGVIDLKGPGTKTSDSINAKLSRHESVMTGDETASSGGILRDIRAGKLNDRKLAKQLDSAVLRGTRTAKDGVRYPGMDDKRIVKEIQDLKNSQVDYAEKFGILYKTRKRTKNLKQWVQTRAMG